MNTDDKIKIQEIREMIWNLKMDVVQGNYDEDEQETRTDILDELDDLCSEYLDL